MIDIDPQIQPEPEPEGYDFCYYTFDPLPALEVHNIKASSEGSTQDDTANDHLCSLPIDNKMLTKLQQEDEFCKSILKQIEKCNIVNGQLYKIEDNILKRFIVDGDDTYETTVIPRSLTLQVLRIVHDELGYNGTHQTYILLKRLYYWKGLKPSVEKHIKRCYQCQIWNRQVVKYARLHSDVATLSMPFMSMDLIGEFHPPTSRKHRYVLTVICMLTGYVFCVPL